MYQVENSGDIIKNKRTLASRLTWLSVSPTVIGLGITSFFTDISSEMVATTLPIYLALVLRLAPLQLGVIDGLYQGAAVLVKIVSGIWADRTGKPKQLAVLGYGLSAISKLGFLLAGANGFGLAGTTIVDRVGKGIRTSPRDAMIAASTPTDQLGAAFGVHRAMDTAGAMIGPLIASVVLWFTQSAYDAVFVVSLCFGLIGLAVLLGFVRTPTPQTATLALSKATEKKKVDLREALKLLHEPRYRSLLIVGTLLSLVTLSDGLLHLNIQRKLNLSLGAFPLLYVGIAFIYMLLAVPFGRLADKLGRTRLFLMGYVFLGMAYGLALLPAANYVVLGGYMLLLGMFYAATDGVLMALLNSFLPDAIRTSAIALFTTFTGLARLLASVVFGAVWGWVGADVALAVFWAGLALCVGYAGWVTMQQSEKHENQK